MVFSSVFFLFLFLPIALAGYFLSPGVRIKNAWLLLVSLWFYSWGEFRYLPLLGGSIAANYGFGLLVGRFPKGSRARFVSLAVAVVVNLALLLYFKYWCFLLSNLMPVFKGLGMKVEVPVIPLPLGISFFTFHALSYLIDVSRGHVQPQKSPFKLALYISLFPQLVAGPIVRYGHVAHELSERRYSFAESAYGVFRFVVGLAKKVLLANTLGAVADQCFALPAAQLTSVHAALGTVCYTLQIYFDFSGYSDMAIGLGRIMGFHFRENFDLPYWSANITEFWKRWHISLTSWFRDYLYTPLTGNTFWVAPWRSYSAMLVVFLLCGFWHGANWTFMAWGFLHGTLLVLDRAFLLKLSAKLPMPVQRLLTILLVMAGWILFRADTFTQASATFGALFHVRDWVGFDWARLEKVIGADGWVALLVGAVAATPLLRNLSTRLLFKHPPTEWKTSPAGAVVILALFMLTAMRLANSSFNPFIYYRF